MKAFTKFPKPGLISFFAACFLLFLINQFYLVLQVSAIMKNAGSVVLLSSVMTAMAIPRIIMLPICGYLMDKIGSAKILRGRIHSLIFTLLSYFAFHRLNLIHTNRIFLFAILSEGSARRSPLPSTPWSRGCRLTGICKEQTQSCKPPTRQLCCPDRL